MPATLRSTLVVTGATGGMGAAVARRLAGEADLLLTDISEQTLEAFSKSLDDMGCRVAAMAGEIDDDTLLAALAREVSSRARPCMIVHTAGLSPVQADWKTILRVNLGATQKLMSAMGPVLLPGSVVVLIASMAGHIDPGMQPIDDLLDRPLDPTSLASIEAVMNGVIAQAPNGEEAASQLAYVLSKRAVIRMARRHAVELGPNGVRVVSVSPGLIHTPMGVKEAEANPQTAQLLAAQPVARWGTPMDIAAAIEFLLGSGASFITGCDLRVDGGASLLSPG